MAYQSAFLALADPTRRHVLERLRGGPKSVGRIAQGMPVSRPAVSQHLRVLKDAGLIRDSKEGTRRVYELDAAGIARLRAHFDQVWEKALGAFQSSAEKSASKASPRNDKAGENDDKRRRKRRRS